jgi:N-acetylneuraminate lyase
MSAGCFEGMEGAFSALLTPFTPDNRVNEEMIGRLIEYQLANGIRGFYVTGSSGEGLLLTSEERLRVVEAAVRYNRGRAKIVVQVGHPSTDEACRLARHAALAGADWISSVGPIFFAQSAEGMFRHYRAISEATDLPFMIYAFRSAIDLERERRLFGLKNVMGMKYTGCDFFSVQTLRDSLSKPVVLFSGADEMLVAGQAMGCFAGGIGTTYNVIPRHFAEICRLSRCGDFEGARRLQEEANRLIRLAVRSENLSYFKGMAKYVGLDCGWFRAPYAPLADEEYEALCAEMDRLGFVRRDQARG